MDLSNLKLKGSYLEWMKDFDVRSKFIEYIEESFSDTFWHLTVISDNLIPSVRKAKGRVSTLGYIKQKYFSAVEKAISRTWRQPTEWDICAPNLW